MTTLTWRLAYLLRITPWERVGAGATGQLEEVVARYEINGVPRRALDIGCGGGSHSVTLACRGWAVTGVDVAPRAIDRARARAATARVDVTFLVADVDAVATAVEPGFQLVLDVGCFHVLSDRSRDTYADSVEAVTCPGSVLLMFAFQRTPRLAPGPRGAATEDVVRRFPGWTMDGEEPVRVTLPRPLRHLVPRLLTLRRPS